MSFYIKIFFYIFFFSQCIYLQCGNFTAVNAHYGSGITINIRDDVGRIYTEKMTIGTAGQDSANITLNVFTSDLDKMKSVINAKSIHGLCHINLIINIYGQQAFYNIKDSNLCVKDMIVVDDFVDADSGNLTIESKFFATESSPTATLKYLQTLKPLNEYYILPIEKQKNKLYIQNAHLAATKYTLLNFLDEQVVLDFERVSKFFYKALHNRIDINKDAFGVKSDGYGVLVGMQKCFDDVDFGLNVGAVYGNSTVNAVTALTDVNFPCDSESFGVTGIAKYYFTDHLFFYSLSGILYSQFKNDTRNLDDTFHVKHKSDWWYFSESLGLGYILRDEMVDVGLSTAFKFDYASSPSKTEKVDRETIKYQKLDGKFLFYDVNCSLCIKNVSVLRSLLFMFGAEFEVAKNISGQYATVNGETETFTCYECPKSLFFAKIFIEKKLSERSELLLSCGENCGRGVKNITASAMISFSF